MSLFVVIINVYTHSNSQFQGYFLMNLADKIVLRTTFMQYAGTSIVHVNNVWLSHQVIKIIQQSRSRTSKSAKEEMEPLDFL